MLVKYKNENEIEMFPNYWKEMQINQYKDENGNIIEKEEEMVLTNQSAIDKAIESGEWLEYVPTEVPQINDNEALYMKYEIRDNKIYQVWEVEHNGLD